MAERESAWYLETSARAVRYLADRTLVRVRPLDRPDYHLDWAGAAEGGRRLDRPAPGSEDGWGVSVEGASSGIRAGHVVLATGGFEWDKALTATPVEVSGDADQCPQQHR